MNGVNEDILKKLLSYTEEPSDWFMKTYRDTSAKIDSQKPNAYSSDYAKMSDDLLQEYLSRGAFSYNPYQDSAYTSYASKMKKEGESAMRETMARASELSGGHNSSYAQSAGQQAYNSYLEKLIDAMGDYEEQAYKRYNDESDSLKDKISLLSSLDSDAYEKYRDTMSDYFKDREYWNGKYENAQSTYNNSQKSVMSVLEKLASMESADFYKWLNANK